MNLKILLNDFKRNKLINASIIFFIMVTATLLSLASLMSVNLFSSIDKLMESAKTPDFLQMHMGEIDLKRLKEFSINNEYVKDYQSLEFLNIDGDKIFIDKNNLDKTVQDLGLVYQSEKFDFLLDLNNSIIDVSPGEVYLPLMFSKDFNVNIGDTIKIYDLEFKVKGFFRDSQMNSNLAGSKRILLSKIDFEKLKKFGTAEYLIEFLLNDKEKISEFEKDYYENIPEKNGPKITYSMFKMINGLNDGLFIAILLLSSFLILIISFLCIRFTLLAKIEDEYREIGIMKAIGLNSKDIKKQYLVPFLLIGLVAIFLGFIIAWFSQDIVLKNIYLYMGKTNNSNLSFLISIIGLLILFFVIILYVNKILNKIKSISPIQAIKNGESSYINTKKSLLIDKIGFFNADLSLALAKLYSGKRQYLTILIVIIIANFIMILPLNMTTTFNDPSFITNMGIGEYDLSMEISENTYSKYKVDALTRLIQKDDTISKFSLIKTIDLPVTLPEGEKAYLKTSFGKHDLFPIKYTMGHAPQNENEIVLTSMYLDDLNLKLGDNLALENGKVLKIVGEYSDISNGGKTAKAIFPIDYSNSKLTYYMTVKDKNLINEIVNKYSFSFPEIKTVIVQDYINQSMGPLIKQIENISLVLIVTSLLVIGLIILLFTRLLIIKERNQIAILKSIGFENKDISKQFVYRFFFILLIGIPIGIVLSNNLGGLFTRLILFSFGSSSIDLIINPLKVYILIPTAIVFVTLIFTKISTRNISKINLADSIKE